MSLQALLDRTLHDPLHTARSGRAIGYLGAHAPIELILAADAMPVQLGASVHGDTASTDTHLADRYLENSFSAQSRLVAQQWLAGELDALEAVIFSRSDDSAQRLYYYLCELQRTGECKGPRPLLYDLAGIQRPSSLAHTIESTKALAAALGTHESRLHEAMQRVAVRAALLDELAKLRASDEVPSGMLAHRILRAARTDWAEDFDHSLQQWLAAPVTTQPQQRLLLIGSVPGDDRLHAAIETDGAIVVGEINAASVAIASTSSLPSAVEAVADRCYRQTSAARSLLQSPANIVQTAQALRADGVIVWMLATDTGLAWEAPRIERAMLAANFPALMLTSQPQAPDATTLDRIVQFAHSLEAR
jgi:benzoyl-CoA reductase/2-hydroxyglutaryl-CoA dehydratase subunit BcrC/BadD/HgdB